MVQKISFNLLFKQGVVLKAYLLNVWVRDAVKHVIFCDIVTKGGKDEIIILEAFTIVTS